MWQINKKIRCRLVVLVIALMLLWTSCATYQPVSPLKIEIAWPSFPDPSGFVNEKDGIVTMPAEYWITMARYVVEAESAHKKYEAALNGR